MVWVGKKDKERIKIRAAQRGMLMIDLFDEIFDSYFKENPRP